MEASPGFFSPIRRATRAVVPMDNPMARAYSRVITASVSPTVATASAPSCATKKMSTMANTDSMAISRIMGTASRNVARATEPWV